MSNLYFNSFRKNFNVLSRMIFIIILILSISKISYSRTIGNLEKNSQEKTFSVKKNNNGKNFPRPRKKATLETDSIKNKTSQEENQVVKIYPKAQKWWTGYTTLSTSGNYDAKDGDIKAGTNLIGGKKNRGYIVFDISDRLRIPSNAIIKYVKLYIYPIKTPLTNYDATIAVKRLTVDPLASPGAEALYKNIGDTKDIVRNPEWYPYTLNQYNSVNLNTGPLQAAITSEKTTWAIGLQDRNKFNLTFDNDNNGGFAGWESNYMPYCEVTYHTPSPAKLSVNTTSIDLGTHPAGYSFSNNSLKISNSGEQTLTGTLSKSANWINSLSITGFSLVANTSTNIPVSGTFPSTTGSFSSTINITSNGGSSTITYKGKIQEIPILNINKTSFDLGTQRGGRNNTEISPAIKNTGTGTLTGSVSTSGDIIASATPASFSLTAGQWIKENIEVSFPTSPGTYSGIVNVTSNGGSGKITVKVIIGTPPTANFSGTPTSGKVPLTVVFTDKSTNNPTSWYWDFGDGSSSNDQNPSHTFQKVGSYTVDLTANSNYGTDDKTIKDYIVVGDAPVADFSASPTSGTAPLNVNFTDKSTNNPTSWAWDFGDGSTSNDQNPSHTYQNAGKYTVKLTATNKYGNDTKTSDNYITAGSAPVADFSASPTSGTAPLNVNFTDKSTNNPTSWTWDFGDGSSSNDQNPNHTYQNAGKYTVKLTATNKYGNDTKTSDNYITAGSAPVADFTASPTSGTAPLNVNFTDKSTNNPTSWTWDFGDGSTSNDQNPSHTYQNAGKYTVKLTATNKYGNDTKTSDNYITAGSVPVADFSASPTTGNAPLTVNFTDKSTGNPTSWSWDFGDGTSSSEQNPGHTYQNTGKYTVKLTATNQYGSNTKTASDYIIVGNAPAANFSASPTSGKAPLTVNFTDKSTGNPTSWSWDFGDGTSSSEQNPSHTYQNVGKYTVKLTATNKYGNDTKTSDNYITAGSAPVADFSASPTSGAAPLNVNFTDKSTNNPTSWTWDFGDGSTSNDQNPSHTYQNAGKYTVKLTATNKYGNDTKSSDNYITAGDAHTGSLKVIISPSEAVDAGAQWNVDGGSWQNSGVTANNLSVGQHTVNYKDVSGWTAPSSMDVTISENQTKSVTGTYIVVSSTSSWKDSFESYTVNTFPSIWTADGNATDNSKNYVDNNYSYEGNQSLRLYGQIGYCWGALAYHPVNLSPPFYITVYIRNGNEILSGCHPNRAGIGLREGTSWQNPDRGFMTFQQDGTITSGGKSVDLGSYESLKWYKIKVLYEVLANNQIKLSYWINDSYKGSEVLSSIDEEDKLTNLSLSVDEGNAWFDNVIISQETDGVNDQHLGQSIKIYPNPTKSGLNIRLKDLSFKNISILLYDSYGKLLTTRHFIQTPSGPVQFHLSGYPAGLYYIQFVTNYGKATKKFIIER